MLCVFVFPIEDMAKYDTCYTHVLKNRCRLEIVFEELEFVVDVAGYFYPITLQFEDLSTAVSKLPHIIIIIIIIMMMMMMMMIMIMMMMMMMMIITTDILTG